MTENQPSTPNLIEQRDRLSPLPLHFATFRQVEGRNKQRKRLFDRKSTLVQRSFCQLGAHTYHASTVGMK